MSAATKADLRAPVAHFSGQDSYALEHAARAYAERLAAGGEPLVIWRVDLDAAAGTDAEPSARESGRAERVMAEIEERIATSPLFGGGTLVVVRQPGALLRAKENRERLLALVGAVPPGNGLCFVDLAATGKRDEAADPLRDAVSAIGGEVRVFAAPTRDAMERWLARRAAELDVRFAPGAVALLAERVGAHVREGDVDRRRQTELANAELEKLALLRPGGTIERDDVDALVADAVPASTWAFLDAIGSRRARDASALADRLLAEGTAIQLIVTQLHRRLRELIVAREHLATGATPDQLPRLMRLQPFRARKLAEQAAAWALADLDAAVSGLLDLDLLSKGIAPDGSVGPISEERSGLGLARWLADHVQHAERGTPERGRGRSAAQSAPDQASSWRTRSDSMAKTQRPSPRSSSSISSGSM